MKAVILAGGLGTRLSEETHSRPKPMVEIGGMPILWHIMKIFESHGINEFIICCGYKGYFIKEYFENYHLRNTDVTFNLGDNKTKILRNTKENWQVTCVDTGNDTLTGGRLKRVKEFLNPDESFLFTYGDGVGDNSDAFPTDASETTDSDEDGVCDPGIGSTEDRSAG